MILIEKGFVANKGKRIKFILASVFHDPQRAESREWVYRLQDDDNRLLEHQGGVQWINDWFAALPVGQWCEIIGSN